MSDLLYKSFVYLYSSYLNSVKNSLNNKYSLYLLPERYKEIKNLKFIRVVRTNYFSQGGYDMWFCETSDKYYYVRYATGLLLISESERYMELPFIPFERLGAFAPPSKEFFFGFQNFKQLADIVGWKLAPDCEEDWV